MLFGSSTCSVIVYLPQFTLYAPGLGASCVPASPNSRVSGEVLLVWSPVTSHWYFTVASPLVVILPLKLTGFGASQVTVEGSCTPTVTPVTMAAGGACTGMPDVGPAMVTTPEKIQQKWDGLPGSRTYHQAESALRPATCVLLPKVSTLTES